MEGDIMQAHRRHDISDEVWKLLEPHLPGRKNLFKIWIIVYKFAFNKMEAHYASLLSKRYESQAI